MTAIIIDLFKHTRFFQELLQKDKYYKLPVPSLFPVIHEFFLQDLYNLVHTALKRLEDKKLATVTHCYTFMDMDGETHVKPVTECRYEEETVLKDMNLKSISQLEDIELYAEFYYRMARLTNSRLCRRIIEIKPTEQILYSYKDEELPDVYESFLCLYREKLYLKTQDFIRHYFVKNQREEIEGCLRGLSDLFYFSMIKSPVKRFTFYRYRIIKKI